MFGNSPLWDVVKIKENGNIHQYYKKLQTLKLSGIKSSFDFIVGRRIESEASISEEHNMQMINSNLSN